jgi:hypothetical protein
VIVSLGSRCEIRYQASLRLARAADPNISIDAFRKQLFAHERTVYDTGSLYFDWLITPVDALIHAIEHDFANMFERADLVPDVKGVRHERHGIGYRHHFTDGAVTGAMIDAGYAQQRAKLDHLAVQTRKVLHSASPVTYVRLNGTDDELARVVSAIERTQKDFRLVAVRYTDGPSGDVHHLGPHLFTCTINDASSGKVTDDDWQGNDEEWAKVFDAIG